MKIIYILYLAIVFLVSYKSSGRNNRMFQFCLFVWILASPILDSKYFIISIPGLFFDFHVNRMLMLIFLALIVLEAFRKRWTGSSESWGLLTLKYEKWILAYAICILLSTFINVIYGNISVKQLIVINTGQLFFLIVYFGIKLFTDETLIDRFSKAVIALSIFSSIAAIIQVFVLKEFFWFGVDRIAYGDIFRAHGIFHSEYTLGFFCITAIIFLLAENRKRYFFIFLNVSAVLLTFHRLSILIMLIMIIYHIFANRSRVYVHMLFHSTIFIITILICYLFVYRGHSLNDLTNDLTKTELYCERISKNTISGRIAQWMNAILIIKNDVFGYGSYDTVAYFRSCAKIGQIDKREIYDYDLKKVIGYRKVGYIVHNGFLGAGAKHGAIGTFSFFMLCFMPLYHFCKLKKQTKNESLNIPILVSLSFLLFQAAQDFSDLLIYNTMHWGIILAIFSKYRTRNQKITC